MIYWDWWPVVVRFQTSIFVEVLLSFWLLDALLEVEAGAQRPPRFLWFL